MSNRIIIALGCLLFLLAACSSSPPSRAVASLPGHATSTPASQNQSAKLVRFTECMRGHGVNMHDPVQGQPYGIPAGQDPVTTAALRACASLMPQPRKGTESGSSGQIAAELPGLIAYARCMRAHDIAMLDPNALGAVNLGHVPGISNGFGRYSPQFRSADAACRHLLPAGVHDDGTGP